MNLFFKIFLWFLAAMAMMVGVALFFTWTLQSDPFVTRFQGIARNQVRNHAGTAAQIYDSEGIEGVKEFLNRIGGSEPIREVGLADESRNLVVNNGITNHRYDDLVERAFASGDTEASFTGTPEVVFAKSLQLKDGRRFVLIAVWNRVAPPPFLGEPRLRYLRLLGLFLTAMLVCYVLAKYLSSPIVKLSQATRELAAGKLSTRVADKIGKRRDEFAKLAADFDEMAERIETLVTSEKRLTRDISHELRSPLARMNVALELAKQKATPENLPNLNRIETESERLNEMIGRLLTLSQLESGSMNVSMVKLDLSRLVRDILEDAEFEARAKGKSVNAGTIDDCRIVGNENLLRSAIENVVRNAVRYTNEGTGVEVGLAVDGSTAEIVVEDHGGGVPDEELDNLFRPFYRLAEARERRSGGAGLGLAIARRAVLAHNGTISASNKNSGLRVSIKLPLNAARQ